MSVVEVMHFCPGRVQQAQAVQPGAAEAVPRVHFEILGDLPNNRHQVHNRMKLHSVQEAKDGENASLRHVAILTGRRLRLDEFVVRAVHPPQPRHLVLHVVEDIVEQLTGPVRDDKVGEETAEVGRPVPLAAGILMKRRPPLELYCFLPYGPLS